MAGNIYLICYVVLIRQSLPAAGFLFIAPDLVAQALTGWYGFAPGIFKGNDHRIGFGFRFGEHADLQILYEIGPQTSTRALQGTRPRPALYRQRRVRRPLLELLVRAGVLHRSSYKISVVHDVGDDDDEPR